MTSAADRDRLEAFLRKAIKAQFYRADLPSTEQLQDTADLKLFRSILADKDHVLFQLLPFKVTHYYSLRKRPHNLALPAKANSTDECNFLCRLMYKDIY